MTEIQQATIMGLVGKQKPGCLLPEQVVEAAKPVKSPLHVVFTWDDGKAAREWRLQEARRIIRVVVTHVPGVKQEVRALVSVAQKRPARQSYQPIGDVLDDPSTREMFLKQALRQLQNIRQSYRALPELAPVFDAVDSVVAQYRDGLGVMSDAS